MPGNSEGSHGHNLYSFGFRSVLDSNTATKLCVSEVPCGRLWTTRWKTPNME